MIFFLLACTPTKVTQEEVKNPYPTLMVTADMREDILAHVERDPYRDVFAKMVEEADREPHVPTGDTWDHDAWGHNGEIAQHNAMLAWLYGDVQAATKAIELLEMLEDDFESNETWDVNIRMPHSLMGYCNALDLLRGTDFISEQQVADAKEKITSINEQFFERYIENDAHRLLALYPSQNNHSIRTAAAIAYVALAFPEDSRADAWANWSFSELDYLWGNNGQYVQADGGISEGPFYYGFAWGVSTALFIAVDNSMNPETILYRDCRNRQEIDPWLDHGCVEGEAFTFTNPLYDPHYHQTVLWSLSLRLPNGNRPPLADSYFNPFNGAALLSGFGVESPEIYIWDWQNNHTDPYHMTHGIDLIGHHLAYVSPAIEPSPPEWTTRFLPNAGHAVFRSDWSEDARWGLLVGEHGAARKTLHDHVDGTSFSIGAYGEYLLIDPGYYKPNILDNARTAHAQSHNVILIDGQGAPDKGLLTDFGDADAWIQNTLDGHHVDYAEAHQTYEQTTFQRSMLLVRDRYFIIADRLQSDWTEPRTHTWRLHAGSGADLGGVFALHSCEGEAGCGVTIEQERAGISVHIDATEGDLTVEEPSLIEGYAPHVHQYDRTRSVGHHGVFDAKVEAIAPNFLAVLAPYPTDASIPAPQVQPIDTPTGLSAWLIESEQGSDLVLLRDDDAPQQLYLPNGSSVSTDAELLLMSLSDDAFTLIANGTNASVNGIYRSNTEFERAISLIENER